MDKRLTYLELPASDPRRAHRSTKPIDPRDRMDLLPADFAIGDVRAGRPDAISRLRDLDPRMKPCTGSLRVLVRGFVMADDLHHQSAPAADCVPEVQDRGHGRIDLDVQIAVRFMPHFHDSTL